MGSCRPSERKIWQAMKREMGEEYYTGHKAWRCAEDYMTKYATFAEAEHPADDQVNDLFRDTRKLITQAKITHSSIHGRTIRSGERAWKRVEQVPGCNPARDVELDRKQEECYGPRSIWAGFQTAVDCSPASTHMARARLEWAAREKPLEEPSGPFPVYRRVAKWCPKIGCSPEEVANRGVELSRNRSWCWTPEIIGPETEGDGLGAALHYQLDQKLTKLENRANFAAEGRRDKVEIIEEFAQLAHHGGPALEFACDVRGGAIRDVFDCLSGVDWEKGDG